MSTRTKTWFDVDGNEIASASVRPLTKAEAAEFHKTWKVGSLMEPPLDRSKYYTVRFTSEVGGGPFDTHAEAMELADKLNGHTRVNGRLVKP